MHHELSVKLALLAMSGTTGGAIVAAVETPADPTSYLTLGGAAVLCVGVLWVYLTKERAALLKAKDDHILALRARVDEANKRADAAQDELKDLLERIANVGARDRDR